MNSDALAALSFLAELDGGLSRAPLPVPGSEECYSGIDVPTRIAEAAVRALKQEGGGSNKSDRPNKDAGEPENGSDKSQPASGLNVPERATTDWWYCEECGYDKDESGGLDKPEICPLCAGDSGGDGRIRSKSRSESAGESVGGIAVPSVEIAPSLSPVGTAPRLPTACPGAECRRRDGVRCAAGECDIASGVYAPPPPAELGLETHEHQRKLWGDAHYDKVAPSDTASMWRRVQMLCRDVGRLSAEVARLTSDVTYWQECFMSGNPAREATARAEERERAAKIIDGFADATGQCQRAAGAIRARTP